MWCIICLKGSVKMFKISYEDVNELQDVLFELGTITYLQNVIRDENNYFLEGFEFLGKSASSFLLDKQTEIVLRLKELLFQDRFNIGV